MNEREIVRRLRAFQQGRPVSRGRMLQYRIAPDRDLLVVAFVRMGGESLPWGVAWGRPGSSPPVVKTVPEPRDRALVAAMMVDFADALLGHLRTPGHVGGRLDPDHLRQVWLPNVTHLEMLYHLAYAYTFTRSGGADNDQLNALGRACGWLFREANRPGSQHLVVATEALRSAFTFPAEDLRQGHLGFLLAWFTHGTRDARLRAALAAERQPISTSLDPELERHDLEPLLEQWRGAHRRDQVAESAADRKIAAVLAGELRRRFAAVVQAITVLRADGRPENPGVARLVADALQHEEQEYRRMERRLRGLEDGRAYVPSVETDRQPLAAARRYLDHEASEDLRVGALIHHDRDLFEEALADGEALEGVIVKIRNEASGRASKPVWTLRCGTVPHLRLRPNTWVSVLGVPSRTGVIRDLTEAGGSLTVEVEIIRGKRADPASRVPAATDRKLVGTSAGLLPSPTDQLTQRKLQKLWRHGPGVWLTRAQPGGALARANPDDREPAEGEPA